MSVSINLVIDDAGEVLFMLKRLEYFNEKILQHVVNPSHAGFALSDDERIEYRSLEAWFEGAFAADILRELRAAV